MTEAFNTIYQDYLSELAEVNLSDRAQALELGILSGRIVLPFFGRPHFVSVLGIADSEGAEPTPAVGTVLLDYLLRNETLHPAAHAKLSFRDFAGAGPLASSFTNNTNHLIAHSFSGRLADLEAACQKLSGVPGTDPIAADLNVKFKALPEVPLYLSFNDRDEDLPAQCNLLFEQSAENYLDLKSCFVLGTFLAGNLI